jgi:hypothetical protein
LMKHEELATTATIYVRRKTATSYGNVAELMNICERHRGIQHQKPSMSFDRSIRTQTNASSV